MSAPERIWLDSDAEQGDGQHHRCFDTIKPAGDPAIPYIRADLANAERDEWCIVVGKVVATIPVRDVLGASATLGDTIKYLEDLHAERDALLKRIEAADALATLVENHCIPNAQLDGDSYLIGLLTEPLAAYRATGEQP